MELVNDMRPAAHLGDLRLCIPHELLIDTEVVGHKKASPFIQKRFGIRPLSFGRLKYEQQHGLTRRETYRGVS
jgi:hypothetical protein